MKKLVINGGKPLKGEVTISGAKNSTVALIPAAINHRPKRNEINPDAKRENPKHACFLLFYGSNSC